MKIKLWTIATVMIGALALTGCQTPELYSQTGETINMPTVSVNLDSDGDGVPDELDMCPGTPENVVVDERGCPIMTGPMTNLTMEYRAFFAKGSSELLPKYQVELDNVGEKMQEYKTATIRIEGHNSRTEVDSASINKTNALAQDRANKVKDYLISKYNITPERITTAEYGARRPIAPSDSEEGNMLNRRVYAIASEPEE